MVLKELLFENDKIIAFAAILPYHAFSTYGYVVFNKKTTYRDNRKIDWDNFKTRAAKPHQSDSRFSMYASTLYPNINKGYSSISNARKYFQKHYKDEIS